MVTTENQGGWKCHSCGQRFETRGKRDTRHRREHQGVDVGMTQAAGNERRGRATGDKFAYFCETKFWRTWSLKWHKQGCYAAIAMIEGGEK